MAPTTDASAFQSLPEPDEWMTSCKGHRLGVRRWESSVTSPKGTVVLQHGGGWHSGYFGGLAASLNRAGYNVAALDAMGHGFSEGPGPKNYWDSPESVTTDLCTFCQDQKARCPESPLFLYAESMGVLLAAPILIKGESSISGLILAGGLFRLHPKTAPPSIVIFILRILGVFFRQMTVRLPSLEATFDEAFGDPRWPEAARSDPNVVVDQCVLGTSCDGFARMQEVISGAPRITCPLLVMHAETDMRTDVCGSKEFFDQAVGSTDKKIIVYPDGAHQLFQDSEANISRHTRDLLEWLNLHSSSSLPQAARV